MIPFLTYVIKVAACSGILFAYYYFFLRDRLFHNWNRFYLLLASIISMLVPFFQFTIYKSTEVRTVIPVTLVRVVQTANNYLEEVMLKGNAKLSFYDFIILGYGLISVILFVFSCLSLSRIFYMARKHDVIKINGINFISTNEHGAPFTFLNYIFWNPEIDIRSELGKQVFQHEMVHINQKHTLDKLWMQLLLPFLWINPFFWLIRNELRLVHEYIADQNSVEESGTEAFARMMIAAAYPKHFNQLVNPFFKPSIKRRISMLKKINNKKLGSLGRLLVLPFIAIVIFSFSVRTGNHIINYPGAGNAFTVIIDAGHGGIDPGASFEGVKESVISLSVAKKVKAMNHDPNLKILLSRESESAIGLKERVKFTADQKASLFISIHLNASVVLNKNLDANNDENGIEVLIPSEKSVYKKQNERLGSIMISQLSSIYKTNEHLLIKKVNVYVLEKSSCPAIMIQCGYLTNKKDKDFISVEANQDLIASKILNAIELYQSTENQKSSGKDGTGR